MIQVEQLYQLIISQMPKHIIQQISIGQLKICQLANQYLVIEENTEFLTQIVKYDDKAKRPNIQIDNSIINVKSLARLVVQVSYLLYTCHVKQKNVYICQLFCQINQQKRIQPKDVYLQYILEKHLLTLTQQRQKYLLKSFKRYQYSTITSQINDHIIKYVNKMINIAISKFELIQNSIEKAQIMRQFLSLQHIFKNYMEPIQRSIKNPRIILLALQESELFRQYSLLVKVMNNSLFSSMRMNKGLTFVCSQINQIQTSLLKVKYARKGNETNYPQQLQKSIEQFMILLIEQNVIKIEKSMHDIDSNSQQKNRQQNSKQGKQSFRKQYTLGQVQHGSKERRYYCKILLCQKIIQQFNEQLLQAIIEEAINNKKKDEQLDQAKRSCANQIMIEFYPKKGVVAVRYFTNMAINLQNTDFMMFMSNSIGFYWSHVTIELVQKSQFNPKIKKNQKYLSFKTLTTLFLAENPMQKIMVMIDLVILCAKIAQPEFRNRVIRTDHGKLTELVMKIDHMIKICIKKIERYYQLLCVSQQ